jgi:hypothetical protein
MSFNRQNHEKSRKDESFEDISSGRKTFPRHVCITPRYKTVRKYERKNPLVRKIIYDPRVFLLEMDIQTRQKFVKLYPKSLYSDAARPRIIISGELARHDFRGFDHPREGVFFLDEQGARMVYGRGKLNLLSQALVNSIHAPWLADVQAYKDKTKHVGICFDKDGREHLILERNRTAAN